MLQGFEHFMEREFLRSFQCCGIYENRHSVVVSTILYIIYSYMGLHCSNLPKTFTQICYTTCEFATWRVGDQKQETEYNIQNGSEQKD